MPELTTSTEVTIDFEVFCDSCNRGLCRQTTVKGNRVYIEPCQRCLEDAKREGFEEGLESKE